MVKPSQKTIEGSRRRRWVRRARVWLPVALVLYTFIGFFMVPVVIRHIVIPAVSDRIVGTITLRRVQCNPFLLSIGLDDLVVRDPEGAVVAAVGRFEGDFEVWPTLFQSGWHFDHARVSRPQVNAVLSADGLLNLIEIIKDPGKPAKPQKPLERIPRVVFREMKLTGGEVTVTDLTTPQPFRAAIDQLSLDLEGGLDTRPDHDNMYSISATTPEGEAFSWKGNFFVDPLSSKGTLTLTGLRLPRFMPYASRFTTAAIEDGRLSVTAGYDFAPVRSPRLASLTVESATVESLAITNDASPVLRVPRFSLENAAVDGDTRRVTVRRIGVQGAHAWASREADGQVSLLKMVPALSARVEPGDAPAAAAAAPPEGAPGARPDPRSIPYPIEQLLTAIQHLVEDLAGDWTLAVESVVVEDQSADVADNAVDPPTHLCIRGLALEAGPIRTEEGYKVPYSLSLSVGPDEPQATGRISSQGVASVAERSIDAAFKADGVAMNPGAPYAPRAIFGPIPAERLASGTISLDGRLQAQAPADGINAAWSGRTAIEQVLFTRLESDAPVIGVASLAITGDTQARAGMDGSLNLSWAGALNVSGAQLAAPLAGEAAATLGGLAVEGVLNAAVSPESGATAEWEGTLRAADLDVSATEVAGPVRFALGGAEVNGKAGLRAPIDGQPGVVFDGDAQAERVVIDAPEQQKANVAVTLAQVTGIKFDLAQRQASIERIAVNEPVIRAETSLIPPSAQGDAPAEQPPPTAQPGAAGAPTPADEQSGAPAPRFRVGQVQVTGGSISVRDGTVSPPVDVLVSELSVDASNIANDGESVAEFAIQSRLQSSGRFRLSGSADPFRPAPMAEIEVATTGLPLQPYSAFSGRFIGYQIDQGRLTTKVPVKLEDGQLKGKLDFDFDRLTLGESVDSPDAPDVPIKLGLALLRDPNDHIKGSISFSGSLDDPSFSVGGIIWDAFLNLIVKAAIAPFQLLAAIFGGGEQDISRALFEPGSTDLSMDGLAAIDTLGTALTERPTLTLEIIGGYATEEDSEALRTGSLNGRMLAWVQRRKTWITQLTPELYLEALRINYRDLMDKQPRDVRRAAPKEPTIQQMEEFLKQNMEIPESQLEDLARQRAQHVFEVLTAEKSIPAERLKISDPVKSKEPAAEFKLSD